MLSPQNPDSPHRSPGSVTLPTEPVGAIGAGDQGVIDLVIAMNDPDAVHVAQPARHVGIKAGQEQDSDKEKNRQKLHRVSCFKVNNKVQATEHVHR